MESFPNPAFAWVFVVTLWSALAAAGYIDLRYRRSPNWLTVPILGAGILANVIRFGWIGYDQDSVASGAFKGLGISLLGFLLGFGLLLLFWLTRVWSGGDGKLFAAVSAWLGWRCSFGVWLVSFFFAAVTVTVCNVVGKKRPHSQLQQLPWRPPYAVMLAAAAVLVGLLGIPIFGIPRWYVVGGSPGQ
jgi:Flp pilus assembly protein protease CpaA